MASPASASISMASSAASSAISSLLSHHIFLPSLAFRRRLCRLPPPFSFPLRSSLRPSTAHFQPTSSSARPFDLLFNRPHQSTEDAPENNNNNQEELFDDISEDSPPSAAPMAERWREYHGSDDWRGLLDPLDEQMRGEIVKYGDLAQLTYDVFDPKTRRCLVKEEDLLKGHGGGYRVTKYIYAKPDVHVMPEWLRKWRHKEGHSHDEEDEEEDDDDDDARLCWMGFVAVTEDEGEMERIGRRDIVVAWRGTVTQEEWLEDMDGALVHWRSSGGGGGGAGEEEEEEVGVERGFWTLYASGGEHSARQQVNGEVRRLVAEFGGGDRSLSITVTGHSLGGALALLSAYDVAAPPVSEAAAPVSVISFAAPRVGNEAFKRRLEEERGVRVLRVVNAHDIVPKVPGILAHDYDQEENGLEEICDDIVDKLLHVAHPTYIHVGTSLHLDNLHSPFLKHSTNLADTHNLEVYLHLLDAFRSSQEPFVGTPSHPNSFSSAIHRLLHISSSLLSRDIALVNKTSALLLDELRVPPYWWTHRSSSSLDS